MLGSKFRSGRRTVFGRVDRLHPGAVDGRPQQLRLPQLVGRDLADVGARGRLCTLERGTEAVGAEVSAGALVEDAHGGRIVEQGRPHSGKAAVSDVELLPWVE